MVDENINNNISQVELKHKDDTQKVINDQFEDVDEVMRENIQNIEKVASSTSEELIDISINNKDKLNKEIIYQADFSKNNKKDKLNFNNKSDQSNQFEFKEI